MRHLSAGTVQRIVDEPPAVRDTDQDHAEHCDRCRDRVTRARQDRTVLTTLWRQDDVPPTATEVQAAWTRLATHDPAAPPSRAVPVPRRSRGRRPTALVLGTALVAALGSTAAATNWFPLFQPDRVRAVSLSASDLSDLGDLAEYGTLTAPSSWHPRTVPDAVAARAATGLPVVTPSWLPRGVSGPVRYAVLPRGTASFRFSLDRAARAAAARGLTLPPAPRGVDGSTVTVSLGPAVVQTWGARDDVVPLMILRLPSPTLTSGDVPLDTLRSYLLAQPGLPADLADQLRRLPADGSTLPLPVPSSAAAVSATTLDGVPATLVKLRDGAGAAVVWIQEKRLTIVLGLISSSEARRLGTEIVDADR